MPFLPLRNVVLPTEASGLYDSWLDGIAARLARPDCDRNALCTELLTQLHFPHLAGVAPDDLPESARIAVAQMDPRNVTLEPEYYSDVDPVRFAQVKPLLWLWEMFDRSPAGENIELGVRFRRILARHIFRRCGSNFKCFQFVKLSFGYNMEVGDNVVVHKYVLLDDRGGIVLGNRVSIADYANVYSHTHDLGDQRVVNAPVTVLADGVRVTYHATILAGNRLEEDSMLGAMGLATRSVPASRIALGIPAHARFVKPPIAERQMYPRTRDPLADPEPEG